jgi:hypothetical protein
VRLEGGDSGECSVWFDAGCVFGGKVCGEVGIDASELLVDVVWQIVVCGERRGFGDAFGRRSSYSFLVLCCGELFEEVVAVSTKVSSGGEEAGTSVDVRDELLNSTGAGTPIMGW